MKIDELGDEQIKQIIIMIKELNEDSAVPKNVKVKLQRVLDSLGDEKENSIKVNEALSELEEVADDNNLQPFTRTQIWNIVSSLEKIHS